MSDTNPNAVPSEPVGSVPDVEVGPDNLASAVPPAGSGAGRRPAKRRYIFIFVTILLDMLAFGIIAPVLPNLIIQFEGGNIARAASITGYFAFAWATMQFIFSPILGAWSDRFGRRPIILISCGPGPDYIFMALAPALGWLFVGRLISGIHETTANMISLGTVALLQHPDVFERLGQTDDHAVVANIVEELMRYLTIVHSQVDRVATEDLTIGGQLIRAGEPVADEPARGKLGQRIRRQPGNLRRRSKHARALGLWLRRTSVHRSRTSPASRCRSRSPRWPGGYPGLNWRYNRAMKFKDARTSTA